MTASALGHPLMSQDMSEQPTVLRRLIRRQPFIDAQLRACLVGPLAGIMLVGRGSSENAARFGQVLFESRLKVPVVVQPPSLARLYGLHIDASGFLAIGLSQSGETPEITETVARLWATGAHTVAITARPNSSLARNAEVVLNIGTGVERAVPATKTFTAELAALIMVCQALDEQAAALPWDAAITAVDNVLREGEPADRVAAQLADAEEVFVLGVGAGVGVAQEAALKILEAAGLGATAMSYESFVHGPLATAGARHPVLAIASGGVAAAELRRVRSRLADTPLYVVGDCAGADLPVPPGLGEVLGLLPATVRVQQLAGSLAVRRDRDADRPPAIEKVTLL